MVILIAIELKCVTCTELHFCSETGGEFMEYGSNPSRVAKRCHGTVPKIHGGGMFLYHSEAN
jgi:hypothetical protein